MKVHEDNVLVRSALSQPGMGKVLVVDSDGSSRSALVGDRLSELALKNNWAGIVVYDCIRDSEAIGQMPIGVLALNTQSAKKPEKRRR